MEGGRLAKGIAFLCVLIILSTASHQGLSYQRQQLIPISVGIWSHIIPTLPEWNSCTLSWGLWVSGLWNLPQTLKVPVPAKEGPLLRILSPRSLGFPWSFSVLIIAISLLGHSISKGCSCSVLLLSLWCPDVALCLSSAPISLELVPHIKFYL